MDGIEVKMMCYMFLQFNLFRFLNVLYIDK